LAFTAAKDRKLITWNLVKGRPAFITNLKGIAEFLVCSPDGARYFPPHVWFSVADPGCLSRILFFTHPGSRIPDPKTATKERGEKKIYSHTFLCSHKFHKIKNYFSF
jgi:hypothetical protein